MALCSTWVPSHSTVFYCANCEEMLTTECLLTDTHHKHCYVTLREAANQQLENIKDRFKMLEPQVRNVCDVKQQVSAAKQRLEDVYVKIKQAIICQYEELWMLLMKNQEQAFSILEAENESLNQHLTQLVEDEKNYHQKSEEMKNKVQNLRKKKKENPVILLEEINALELSLMAMEDFYSSVKEIKFDGERLRALEESVKKIVRKNKEILPRPWEYSQNVTFNKNIKHKDLKVSEHGSEVFLKGSCTCLSKGQRAQWSSIVANQSFKKGQHYWEVEVEGSKSWALGVVEQGWEKRNLDRPLGRDRASWSLESDEGDLTALHGHDLSTIKCCNIHRVGVYMNCDKGQVMFYNVATGCVLHSFSFSGHKQLLYPAFSLRAEANCTVQLKIRRMIQEYDQFQQHNDQNDRLGEHSNSEEPDSGAFVESGEVRSFSEYETSSESEESLEESK